VKKWILREIAEVLGVVGVIGSLAFVALEIRQNTSAVRSAASQGVQDQVATVYQMYATDPTLTGILQRGMQDPSNLTPEELARFDAFWTVALQANQNVYVQIQEGAFDNAMAEGWWQLLRSNLEYPGLRQYWATRSFLLSPSFREFVETEVMARDPIPDFHPLGLKE
jgi:hypothetical protein